MEEFAKELLVVLIGAVAAKALDELVEAIKEKASRKHGKHSRRP